MQESIYGASCQMRRNGDVVKTDQGIVPFERLMLKNIQCRSLNPLFLQRRIERRFVDESGAQEGGR